MATVNKEVTTTTSAAPMIVGADEFSDFFGDVELTQQDMIIPMIKLMQAGSDLVKDDQASAGEYRKSTGELLAEKDKDLELIVFKLDKYYVVNQVEMTNNGKVKVKGSYRRENFTVDGPNDWEFEDDGKTFRRDLIYAFYVIIANDKGEEVFNQMPSIITFSSSSKKSAKNWLSKLQNMRAAKKEPHSNVFSLGRSKEIKDKNSWLIPTVSVGRETTKLEQEAATLWRTEFKSSDHKVHGEEE